MFLLHGDTLDLNQCVLGQACDLESGTGGEGSGEELCVHSVHGGEVSDVGKQYGGLDHVGHLGAGGSRYTDAKLTLPLQRRWIFDLKNLQAYHSSPILADGKIFFAVSDGNVNGKTSGVIALDAQNGKLLWKYSKNTDFYATPTIANGRIFAADSMGSVVILDAQNGKQLRENPRTFFNSWRYQLAATPLLFFKNTIFINSYDGLRAINAVNGRRIWRILKQGR